MDTRIKVDLASWAGLHLNPAIVTGHACVQVDVSGVAAIVNLGWYAMGWDKGWNVLYM